MKETRIWIVADRQYRGYERLRVKIMKISELLQRIDYTVLQGDLSEEITGICHDNRMLQKGDAFICISGARFDTHTMAGELAKKAALLVVEKPVELDADCKTAVVQVASTRDIVAALAAAFYGYPSEKVVCIGITGSKGKTTCTHMMADILRAAGYLTGTIGTNGAIMPAGCDHAVWGSDKYSCAPCNETPGYDCYELNNTTPDPMELQMYLAMMVKAGCTHVVLEVSSQGMKQKRVATVDFAYAVWTNIETGDHIGPNEHKDFEEYLYCKAMLLNQSRRAYVNCDDRHLDAFMKYVTNMKLYPLQVILRDILISGQSVDPSSMDPDALEIMKQIARTIKYGVMIVSSLPVLIMYPFVQKYFVKGVMIGSVKG